MYVFINFVCPKCYNDFEDLREEFATMNDGEKKEIKCKCCGKEFWVNAEITVDIERVCENDPQN